MAKITVLDEDDIQEEAAKAEVVETKNTKIVINNWEDEVDEEIEHPTVDGEDEPSDDEEAADDEWHMVDEAEAEQPDDDQPGEPEDEYARGIGELEAAASSVEIEEEPSEEAEPVIQEEDAEVEVAPDEEPSDVDVEEEPAPDEPEEESPVDAPEEPSETDEPEITTDDSIIEEAVHPESVAAQKLKKESQEPVDSIADEADKQAAKERAESIATLAKKQKTSRLGGIFAPRKFALGLIVALVIAALAAFFVPALRYQAMNFLGMRTEANFSVVDAKTQQPIEGVKVTLGDDSVDTNENGTARFEQAQFGDQSFTVQKPAYEEVASNVVLGLSSESNLPVIELVANGDSFTFELVDWFSLRPITDAKVSFAQNSASVNEDGVATLNIPSTDQPEITVQFEADGYKMQDFILDTSTEESIQAGLVIDRNHFFLSDESGTLDVYSIGADGDDRQVILEGTGSETDSTLFDVSPSGLSAALVATRDSDRVDAAGNVLSTLSILNTQTNELVEVDASERIDLIGWIGESVIYTKVEIDSDGQDPERYKLSSYNTATSSGSEIASSNFFNDVLVARNFVFFAPAETYKQNPKPFLFRSNADGTSIETVFERDVWTVVRSGVDSIIFDSEQEAYEGMVDSISNSKLDERPEVFISTLLVDSPSNDRSVRVDVRDEGGALVLVDQNTGEETELAVVEGLTYPLVWLDDDHIVYRVNSIFETADYILSASSPEIESVKISDTSNISGVDRWYFQ